MAGGRPTKYRPEMCEEAIELVGRQGKSLTQLAGHYEICRDTLWRWRDTHKEFSDALTRAEVMSQTYWENELIDMMRDPKVNAPLVKLYFANRFKWHDRPVEEPAKLEIPPIVINTHESN